jgi:excinuclease ABC subunit B
MSLVALAEADYVTVPVEPEEPQAEMSPQEREMFLASLEQQMREAAKKFEFEKAAQIRDKIKALRAAAAGLV